MSGEPAPVTMFEGDATARRWQTRIEPPAVTIRCGRGAVVRSPRPDLRDGRRPHRCLLPTHEARAFQPSSFASRKAEADAAIAQRSERRIVSLGETEFTQRNQKTGEVEYLPARLFMDADKPMERFIEVDGMPGRHALHSVSGKEDTVTPIRGTVRVRGRGPGSPATPSIAEPPPRPI